MKSKSVASAIVLVTGLFVAACGGGQSTGDALKKTTESTTSKIEKPTGTFDESKAAEVGATAAATASAGTGGLSGAFGAGLGGGGMTPSAPSGTDTEAFRGETTDLVINSLNMLTRGQSSSGMACQGATDVMSGKGDGKGECSCGEGSSGKILFEGSNVSALSSLKMGGKDFDPAKLPTATLVVYYDCSASQSGASYTIKGGIAVESKASYLVVGADISIDVQAQGQSVKQSVVFGYAYINGDIWVLVESPKGNQIAVATGKYDATTRSGSITVADKNGKKKCDIENGQKKACTAA